MLINIIFGCLKKKKETDVKQSVVTIQWQNCILYIIGYWENIFENLTFIKNNCITSYLNIYNISIWNISIYNNQASVNLEFLKKIWLTLLVIKGYTNFIKTV